MTFVGACVAALAGCSNDDQWTKARPKVVPVSGEVFLLGKPVSGAYVTFNNAAAGYSAAGVTDDSGRFVLRTFKQSDGAVPGTQQVIISKVTFDYPGTELQGLPPVEQQQALAKLTDEGRAPYVAKQKVNAEIPERYGIPSESGLTAEVAEKGENHFRFDLTQ